SQPARDDGAHGRLRVAGAGHPRADRLGHQRHRPARPGRRRPARGDGGHRDTRTRRRDHPAPGPVRLSQPPGGRRQAARRAGLHWATPEVHRAARREGRGGAGEDLPVRASSHVPSRAADRAPPCAGAVGPGAGPAQALPLMAVAAALLVGLGLALVLVGLMLRVRDRETALAEILDLPFGERDVPVEAVSESASSTFVEETIGLAGRMVSQFDPSGSLALSLERAQIPLRPGEYVIITASGAIVASILLSILTSHWWLGIGGVLVAVAVAYELPKFRSNRRRKAFEAQLPDALTLIASSLSAGHTFLRSVQMMCEEAEPPLADEFARVVQETRLGDPVVDAIDRMADRLDIRDVRWVVQAIRI